MASMVEFQDFKLGQHMFPDTNDLQAFEEWLSSMDLPTPPLSPDPTDSTATNTTHLDTTDDIDVGETILQHMIESENVLFDSQSSNYGSEDSINVDMDPSVLLGGNPQALLQDCMWNSDVYEPRHSISNNGIYTPAPSPPPDLEERDAVVQEEEEEISSLNGQHSRCCSEQTECISPTEVFAYMETTTTNTTTTATSSKNELKCRTKRKAEREARQMGERRHGSNNVSSDSSRDHPRASTSSESEEEIDVVTITDKQNSKKRNYSTSSLSTPSSRQASPTHMPSTKKRKGHSKRMHRLNSSGSNFGGDGTESDDEQRRASHNVLERKRRNDLKYSFQILRGQIPELEDNQRAPKVTILKKAAEYIKEIREKEEDMQSRLAREVRRESKLLQRLAYLKSMP